MKHAQWRILIIASVAFFISAIGAYDYVMTLTHNTAYFTSMDYSERQIAYFTDYPWPLTILWTFGVWGTVVGSLLLLVRARWAAWAYLSAVTGQVILDIFTFAFKHRWEVLGPRLCIQDLIILVLTACMAWYAWRLSRQ